MNQSYDTLIKTLDLSDSVADCAAGRITFPLVALRSPAEWYGFPPVLIPIWSDGSGPSYIGIWKHWFTDRPLCFVKMYVGSGRMTIEIARTAEQLLCYMAMATISVDDGVEPELEKFCERVGLQNLSEIDNVSLSTGDDPLGFTAIRQFATDTPLACTNDLASYSGMFPTGSFERHEWWRDACSFEVPGKTLTEWPDTVERPDWLNPGEKRPLFQQQLRDENLHDAWLTLNSSGWSFADAKSAIMELERTAKDKQFSLLTKSWLSIADEGAGSY